MLIVVRFIPLVYQEIEIESDCFRKLLDLKPITESTATKIYAHMHFFAKEILPQL